MNRHLHNNVDALVGAMLKIAAFSDIAESAGKHLVGLKDKAKNLGAGAADAGERFMKGVGVTDPEKARSYGKTLGYGTVGGAGLYAANKGFNKTQDFRRRHNFGGGGGQYGGY